MARKLDVKDKQAKKMQVVFMITWFLMLLIVAILLLIYVRPAQPGPRGLKGVQGSQGARGEPATVDYAKIDQIISGQVEQKVSQIPTPTNGKDGYTPVKGQDYNDGKDGKDGTNGVDGRQRLIRFNPDTKSFETQLEGDDFWEVLLDVCTEFPKMCEDK